MSSMHWQGVDLDAETEALVDLFESEQERVSRRAFYALLHSRQTIPQCIALDLYRETYGYRMGGLRVRLDDFLPRVRSVAIEQLHAPPFSCGDEVFHRNHVSALYALDYLACSDEIKIVLDTIHSTTCSDVIQMGLYCLTSIYLRGHRSISIDAKHEISRLWDMFENKELVRSSDKRDLILLIFELGGGSEEKGFLKVFRDYKDPMVKAAALASLIQISPFKYGHFAVDFLKSKEQAGGMRVCIEDLVEESRLCRMLDLKHKIISFINTKNPFTKN